MHSTAALCSQDATWFYRQAARNVTALERMRLNRRVCISPCRKACGFVARRQEQASCLRKCNLWCFRWPAMASDYR